MPCSLKLLQFGTVAQKKVGEIEKNYKINQDLNLGDSITENLLCFVSIMKNCVKTVSSIVHNWNLIYTLFPQISGSIQWVS
jgi:hypothetical protein